MRSILIVTAGFFLISSGPARAQDVDSSDSYTGKFFAPLCGSKMDSERALCTFYLRGMNDLNDFLLHVAEKPLWCLPDGTTVEQMRLVVMTSLNQKPEELHLPFAGLVMVALDEKFPCPDEK